MEEKLNELIIGRRSIRRYKNQKINTQDIKAIIHMAMYAPSAVNKRPWHFIVIEEDKLKNKIMEINPNAKMLKNASHAILICGDEKLQHDDNYWTADCGAATQNILLGAHSLGIGSCWIGIYPRKQRMEAVSELFNLPTHIKIFSIVSLGYADEEKSLPNRIDPEKIHWGKW